MSSLLQPWHILLAALCGLVNQRQQQIIEFQNAQIDALLKQLGKRRLLHNDDQSHLLAVKAHAIGHNPPRKGLSLKQSAPIFAAADRRNLLLEIEFPFSETPIGVIDR